MNDSKLIREMMESIPVEQPRSTRHGPQGVCPDMGYNYDEVRGLLDEFGFAVHIRSPGNERLLEKRSAGFKLRRRVVDGTYGWMHHFRRILIRGEMKRHNHLGFLCLTSAIIRLCCPGASFG